VLSRSLAYLQYLVPRYALTALVYRLARIRRVAIKNFLIERFIRLYRIDTADVRGEIPDAFGTFNEFFVRELRDGTRPIDAGPGSIVSPVDGTVSQAGTIVGDALLQAKGRSYTLDDLLAIELEAARRYENGMFATIYLAPYNYHRVHAPLAGRLVAAHYVPGDLFSVNAATAAIIPGLFRRNERVVLHFETVAGPAAVVLVGALNVGSISTPWSGELRPRRSGVVEIIDITGQPADLAKGDLLGWFNMGSTVIVLLPASVGHWHRHLVPGQSLRMGEAIGSLGNAGP
jgi:phosphatidylserine decarboxylase